MSRFGAAWEAKIKAAKAEPSKGRRTLQEIVHAAPVVVLGIDPGPSESAWVLLVDGKVADHFNQDNEALLTALRNGWPANSFGRCHVAIEGMEPYGYPPAEETFATCMIAGRFQEAATQHHETSILTRKPIVMNLTGKMAVKGMKNDTRVKNALLLRFGHNGTWRDEGPLKGISTHKWAALAVAVTASDKMRNPPPPGAAR